MEIIHQWTHQPVMVNEVIESLALTKNGIYIDATFGRGGHTQAILKKLGPSARILGFDKDPKAIEAGLQMAEQDDRLKMIHGSFAEIKQKCIDENILGKVNGILMDLGVSSPQLDDAERGFSFRKAGPLDMRMNPNAGITASEWVNSTLEADMAFVFKSLGEEKFAKRIARAIALARATKPFVTTEELSEVIKAAHPAWERHKHPATKCFQAIRIYINEELDDLKKGLTASLDVLKADGRMVMISFHSLEDRIVKRFIQKNEQDENYELKLPIPNAKFKPRMKRVGKKLTPSLDELNHNPRSRSAVLRVAEKVY